MGAAPLDTDVAIETPEHIVFRHRVAGPTRRLLAYALDAFLCWGVVLVVAVAVTLASSGMGGLGESMNTTFGVGLGILLLLIFCVQWVYFVVWEGWKGASLGKMALGLRVVTTSGRPIGYGAAALRNVLRGADSLPVCYVVGFFAMLASPRFQRLGDLVAGTMVVIADRKRTAATVRLWPPAQPAELAAIPDDVVLDPDERLALELFLRRRGTLGPAREHELAQMVVDLLAHRHGGRVADPARALALLYDRAANAGREEAPPSSRAHAPKTAGPSGPPSWRSPGGPPSWR